MQPVQDLTIDATVSRAPYQFVLEDANPGEFDTWVPSWWSASALPQLTDVASDLQHEGLDPTSSSTAPPPAASAYARDGRQALYDAFGQRIISTIYTQSNQYRVIMEVDPAMQALARHAVAGSTALVVLASTGRCRCRRSCTSSNTPGAAVDHHFGQLPATTVSFNLAAGRLPRRCGGRDPARRRQEVGLPPSFTPTFQGTALAFQSIARQRGVPDHRRRSSPCTSCSGCSTRASSTRSPSSRPCPRPASARCWR